MKAEINIENKARFFALYWGQEIMGTETIPAPQNCFVATGFIDGYYLNLKHLSLISDQDILKINELIGVDDDLDENWEENLPDLINHLNSIDAFLILGDYFRSQGFALPWMGLSVKELVESGWIKLVEL